MSSVSSVSRVSGVSRPTMALMYEEIKVAKPDVNKSLSFWGLGQTTLTTNNLYHLKSGNVGIGMSAGQRHDTCILLLI